MDMKTNYKKSVMKKTVKKLVAVHGSLRNAANATGVSAATLSRLQRGAPPDVETLARICNNTGIQIGEFFAPIKGTRTNSIAGIIKNNNCPLPISVIPNNMGISLCSVDSVSWHKQPDGQLTSLTIKFKPNE
jgi:transcriptional regulator with XRE-family HTH domain